VISVVLGKILNVLSEDSEHCLVEEVFLFDFKVTDNDGPIHTQDRYLSHLSVR